MKGKKLLRNLGWIFIIFGILQQLVYLFTVKQFHNSIFDLVNTLSIYSGRDSFIWLGLAILLLGRIKSPINNNNELPISTKDSNELENKKENPNKNIIWMITGAICVSLLMYYIHDPWMFKDGTWAIFFGLILLFLAIGFCIYAIQTTSQFMKKQVSKNPHRACIIGAAIFIFPLLLVMYIIFTFYNNLILDKLDKNPSPIIVLSWFFFDLFLIGLSLMGCIFSVQAFWQFKKK